MVKGFVVNAYKRVIPNWYLGKVVQFFLKLRFDQISISSLEKGSSSCKKGMSSILRLPVKTSSSLAPLKRSLRTISIFLYFFDLDTFESISSLELS